MNDSHSNREDKNNSFNKVQDQKLRELFGEFYKQSQKVKAIATITKDAITLQEHTSQKLDLYNIDVALQMILDHIELIENESGELSILPNALFWGNQEDIKTTSIVQ